MDKELETKLLDAKASLTINKIVEAVKINENKDIHKGYALEKFESYVSKYQLNVSEKEKNYLVNLRVQMYDNKGVFPAKVELEVKPTPNNVVNIKSAIKKNKP